MNRVASLRELLSAQILPVATRIGVRPALLRIRDVLGVSEGVALLVLTAALGAVALGGSVSARLGLQTQAAGAALAFLAVLVSLRWPLLPLYALALLIPIDDVAVVGGLGTLGRYAEILFIVAYGIPRLGRLALPAIPLPAWGYVAWAILSLGWALDPGAALAEVPILILLFTTAVVVAALVVERPNIIRPLLSLYSLSSAVTAALGIYAFFTAGGVVGPNDRGVALPGQDPAAFAAIMLPALVFSLHQLLQGRRVLANLAIAALCGGAIAVSGTRGAWVSAIVVVVLFFLPRLRLKQRIVAIAIIATVGVVALQIPGLGSVIAQRAGIALSTGGAGRTDIWAVGLTIYLSAPLTGVGLANFPVAYTPQRVRASPVGAYSANIPPNRSPHSILIGTLAELGPLGLFLLASFLAPLILRRGWGPDAATVQAAFASLVIMALFLDVLNRKQVWLLAGLACGLAYLARDRDAANGIVAMPKGGVLSAERPARPGNP